MAGIGVGWRRNGVLRWVNLRAWGREGRGRGGGNGEEHGGFLKEARVGRFFAFTTEIEEEDS